MKCYHFLPTDLTYLIRYYFVIFLMVVSLMVYFTLPLTNSFNCVFVNIIAIFFNSSVLLKGFKDFKVSTCFSVCLSKAFTKGEYINVAYSIIWLPLEGNISSPLKYSYLSIFPDYDADIFAASLLIFYYSFSSSIFMISLYIICKRLFMKR